MIQLTAGNVVDSKYEVKGQVGEGGLGTVYRARDIELGRDVALKFLSSDYTNTLKALRKEAAALAQLEHANILRVFAVGMVGGHPYLITEFVEGMTLSKVMQAGSLTVDQKLDICEQILKALTQVHSAGLIHRDLKPDNIITSCSDGRLLVKLIDFGLSKNPDGISGTADTLTGALVGTPRYMSPEQCEGRRAGPESDLYAFGCVACELITGRAPFECDTPWAYLSHHAGLSPEIIRPPDIRDGKLWNQLDNFLRRALQKKPADRFASAEAMLEVVSGLKTGQFIDGGRTKHLIKITPIWLPLLIIALVGVYLFSSRGFQARKTQSAEPTILRHLAPSDLQQLLEACDKPGSHLRPELLTALVNQLKNEPSPEQACQIYLRLLVRAEPGHAREVAFCRYAQAVKTYSSRERAALPLSLARTRELLLLSKELKVPPRYLQIVLDQSREREPEMNLSIRELLRLRRGQFFVFARLHQSREFIALMQQTMRAQMTSASKQELCLANFILANGLILEGIQTEKGMQSLSAAIPYLEKAIDVRAQLPKDAVGDYRRDVRNFKVWSSKLDWGMLQKKIPAAQVLEELPSVEVLHDLVSQLKSLRSAPSSIRIGSDILQR